MWWKTDRRRLKHTAIYKYRVSQKKGLVIVGNLATTIIFKLTPILLDINMPYSRVNLSYFGGHYDNIFMDILVTEVSAIFAKMMEFWQESSNVEL